MSKWRTVHVADAHLQDGAYPHLGVVGDAYYSFEQAVDMAIENKADTLVADGDLLDVPRNRPGPVNFLHRQVDRLRDAGVAFEYIQGQPNHDQCSPSWAAGHPWAVHLHRTVRTHDDGFTYYGIDFQPNGLLQQELSEIPPGTDLLVAHQAWADWMGDITHPQGEFADVPVVRSVITGDLHEFKLEKKRGKDGQEMTVCSPGSIAMQAINEPPDKYIVVLSDEKKFCRVRLKTRRVFRSHLIENEDDLDRFLDEGLVQVKELIRGAAKDGLPEQLLKPLVEVTYHHSVAGVVKKAQKSMGEHCHLFLKEIRPSKDKGEEFAATVAKGQAATPLGMLDQEVDPVQFPHANALLKRLLPLSGKDLVQQEIQKWRQEYLSRP